MLYYVAAAAFVCTCMHACIHSIASAVLYIFKYIMSYIKKHKKETQWDEIFFFFFE